MIKLRLWLGMIVVLAGCGGGGTSRRRATARKPPPRIAAHLKTFKLGGEVWAANLAAEGRNLWVTNAGRGTVTRVTLP